MKQTFLKTIAFALTLLLLIPMLAACLDSVPQDTEGVTQAPTDAPVPTETEPVIPSSPETEDADSEQMPVASSKSVSSEPEPTITESTPEPSELPSEEGSETEPIPSESFEVEPSEESESADSPTSSETETTPPEDPIPISEGLEYTLMEDGTYKVTGIGTCMDREIIIPATHDGCAVTRIGSYAFEYSQLVERVILPEGLLSIGEYAFSYCTIVSITLPESLVEIEKNAFYGCLKLSDITLPPHLTAIRKEAFRGCNSLTSITLPDSLLYVGEGAFWRCNSLQSITIPALPDGIDSRAFAECTALSDVTISEELTRIGSGAFEDCTALERITIPKGVTSIESAPFSGCVALKELAVSKENSTYHVTNACLIETATGTLIQGFADSRIPTDGSVRIIGHKAFARCKPLTDITIPAGVVSIAPYAFYHCTNLSNVTLPTGLEKIGESAFHACQKLDHIPLPEGLKEIGRNAFSHCEKLKSVILPSTLIYIGESAFSYCTALEEIEPAEGLREIEAYAFLHCKKLKKFEIPAGVRIIGEGVFKGCSSLASVTVSAGNTHYRTSGNALIEIATGTLIAGCPSSDTTIILPEDILRISPYALSECPLPAELILPDTLTEIGDGAFSKCQTLVSVTLPPLITKIRSHTFSECKALEYVSLPKALESIGDSAFFGCTALKEITLPNNCTEIADHTFNGCKSLTEITIPEGVTAIGYHAFANCSALEKITVPKNVTVIYASFYGCENLSSAVFEATDGWTVLYFPDTIPGEIEEFPISYLNDPTTAAEKLKNNFEGKWNRASEIPEDPPIYTDPEGLDTYDDLGGYRYRALVRTIPHLYHEDFWVDVPTSDPLTIAIYERNAQIESEYNCKIIQINSQTEIMHHEMKQFYLNGEAFELSIIPPFEAVSCMSAGLLQDIYSLENIRTEHPAYDQDSVKQHTLGEKLYFLSGDMNISTLDNSAVTIFNPELFEKYDFTELCGKEEYANLYQLVKDGKWTVDAMLEMARAVASDNDASGGMLSAPDGDDVGYFQYSASSQYYYYGCGARISSKDPYDGLLEISYQAPHAKAVYSFLFERLNTAVKNPALPAGTSGTRTEFFGTGKTLFTDLLLWDLRKGIRERDFSYGILPIPKYSETQARYYDICYYPYHNTAVWAVPALCENADHASFMFHVMAVYSSRPGSTMDAYTKKTLCPNYDTPEAREVFKTVRKSVTYDMALLFDWGGFTTGPLRNIKNATEEEYEAATTPDALSDARYDVNRTLSALIKPNDLSHLVKTEDGMVYTLLGDGTYMLLKCENLNVKHISIPAEVNGIAVTQIGSYAFSNRAKAASRLTVPESITVIEYAAFQNCTALTDVTLPETLTEIGAFAFYGCTSLELQKLPEALKSIGSYAFSGCTSLDLQKLPEALKSIGAYAFYGCSSLVSATLPAHLEELGTNAFAHCDSLTSFTIPEGITTIKAFFDGCKNLREVIIHEKVTQIASDAFTACSALSSAVFEDPLNWKIYQYSESMDTTNVPASGLNDPETAAVYLTVRYAKYTWNKADA